ncbi:MAG: TIGR01841 family phasin [Burkholderiales bacterium]|nr:TIGR01841 family phasin [Burkholderiales bacterium]
MYSVRDHFSEASQASLEAQLALNAAIAEKLLEGVQRFAELNKSVVAASLQDMENMARELLAADNPQSFISTVISQAQPILHKAFAYGCHMVGISAGTQTGLADLAASRIAATNREVTQLVAEVSKNAPPGFNRVITFVRTLYDHANAGYEQITVVTRQVMDALETNLIAAANQFARAAEQVRPAARAK